MLVIQLKTNNTNINKIGKKSTNHNHDKYITTPEFIKLTAENFSVRIAQANLVTNTDFDNELVNLNKNIKQNKTYTC